MHDGGISQSKHQLLVPLVVFFLGVPLIVVVHEFGHYLAARAYGYPAHLSFAAVNFSLPKSDYEGIPGTIISSAGPLANLMLAFAGSVGLLFFPKDLNASKAQWVVIWVLTLLVSGGGRGLLKALSPAGSDEADLIERFGIP